MKFFYEYKKYIGHIANIHSNSELLKTCTS